MSKIRFLSSDKRDGVCVWRVVCWAGFCGRVAIRLSALTVLMCQKNLCPVFIALFAMSGRWVKIASGHERSCFPTQAVKSAAWMGHPLSWEN